MTAGNHQGTIKRILVVASTERDESTIRAAFELAARFSAEVSILICARKPAELNILARVTGRASDEVIDGIAEEKRSELEALVTAIAPGHDATIEVTFGEPFVEAIRRVIRDDIGLVVKTAEPLHNISHILFSSADQHLVRKCPCPVWLRLPECAQTVKTIVAAVDLDEWDADQPETLASLNRRVLDTADLLAAGQPGATVHVVNAWEAVADGLVGAFSSGQDLQQARDTYTGEIIARHSAAMDALIAGYDPSGGGYRLSTHILRGTPREVITQHASRVEADIVVMGTVARTGLSGIFIGNTAEDMLNSLQCSVVTVKPDGFVSPLADMVAAGH